MDVQNLLKSGSNSIKDGASVIDVITSLLKPTIGAVLTATVNQDASNLLQMRDNHDATLPPI